MVPTRATSASSAKHGAAKAFRGWPLQIVEFFDGLEVDNTKNYWTAHKDFYDVSVLAPMQALLAELTPEFGEGTIFRPYRDTRFSADKSPYKTTIAAHNDAGYLSLSADSLGVGSGLYMPAPAQLTSFRAAVADERTGPELLDIVKGLERKGIQVSAHETLKSAPRGYPKDHPRIDLLRYKGITAWREWPVGPWLASAAAKRRVVDVLRATAPLRQWLGSNVGAPDGP